MKEIRIVNFVSLALAMIATVLSVPLFSNPAAADPGRGASEPRVVGLDDQFACTNFVAAGSGSATGEVIASKNRDLQYAQVMKFVQPEEGYAFIGAMSMNQAGISQGINEHGLSIGHTWMPVPKFFSGGHSPFIVNQLVLENCASVDEAIAFIRNLPKQQGATYMVADKDKAAFIETVPSLYTPDTVAEVVEDGVRYHTNHYIYEPFYSWVIEDGFGYMWTPSYVRYDRAAELVANAGSVVTPELVMSFTRDLESFGNGHVTDVYAAHPEVPSGAWSNGWPGFSINNTRTVSSTVFVLDKEHPELLSEMWMAMYNPAYSAYTPLHNAMLRNLDASTDGLEMYIDGRAWQTAANLRDSEIYEWGELYPDLETWESAAIDATVENEAIAADLIDDGKPAAAAAYLTESDIDRALDAIDLLIDAGAWVSHP